MTEKGTSLHTQQKEESGLGMENGSEFVIETVTNLPEQCGTKALIESSNTLFPQ